MKRISLIKIWLVALILLIASINVWSNSIVPVVSEPTTVGVNQSATPTIAITEIITPTFVTSFGNSIDQTVNISGVNLTGDILMTLSGTNADAFSISQSAISPSGGIAPNTFITVSYLPLITGIHNALLTLSSAGAVNYAFSLSGTAGLETPVALAATNITNSGFTANWNAINGTSEYQLNVFTKGIGATIIPLVGSPFTVSGSTSKSFTGLQISTDYYYTLTAKIGTATTASSNEILVSTLSTGLSNTLSPLTVVVLNRTVKFTATVGEVIELYNEIGQKLVDKLAVEGVNTIPVLARGVVLVRVGSRMAKVIM